MFLYFPFLFLCAPHANWTKTVINIITIFPNLKPPRDAGCQRCARPRASPGDERRCL